MNDFDPVNDTLIADFEYLSSHIVRTYSDASSCANHMTIIVEFAEELSSFAKLPHEFAADLSAIFRSLEYARKRYIKAREPKATEHLQLLCIYIY